MSTERSTEWTHRPLPESLGASHTWTWTIARPAELCYWIGGNPCIGRVVEGH